MAHNLMIREDGKAAMFYVGDKPWHGLGTELQNLATAQEAIEAAGLGYDILQTPVVATQGGQKLTIPGMKALIPADRFGKPDCPCFGVVSDTYKVIQNREAFGFFDNIVGKGEAVYETAGALSLGEKIWILAKLPENLKVGKQGDEVAQYILLYNSHTGKAAARAKLTPVRVVCQNTLNASLKGDGASAVIRHTGDVMANMRQASELLGFAKAQYAEAGEKYNLLASTQANKAIVNSFLNEFIPMPAKPKTQNKRELDQWAEAVTAVKFDRGNIVNLFESGTGNHGESLWDLYNGVTEYTDHFVSAARDMQVSLKGIEARPWRAGKKAVGESRLNSVWFGKADKDKADAFELLLKRVA